MNDIEIREFVKANTAIGSIEGCVSQNMTIYQLTELVKKALEREQEQALNMHDVMPSAWGVFTYKEGKVYAYCRTEEEAEQIIEANDLYENLWYADELVFTKCN